MRKLLSIIMVTMMAGLPVFASSHREAPFITEQPKVDGTDVYAFRSYETGKEDFTILMVNYQPFQDPFGGPNYYDMDPEAIYAINVDNDGDSVEDISFLFRFQNTLNDLQLNIGGQQVSVALKNIGTIGPAINNNANLHVRESYTLEVVEGRRVGAFKNSSKGLKPFKGNFVIKADGGDNVFEKPYDNVGQKTFPTGTGDYNTYANNFIFDANFPNCPTTGRVFVGQRKEPFDVNVGEVFDLVNLNPLGPTNSETSDTELKNITTLAIEIPTSCLTSGDEPVIGVWTDAFIPSRVIRNNDKKTSFSAPERVSRTFARVSRLGSPLVNELVIGLKDKNKFNASHPSGDAQFATYVTNPTVPAILEILFGVTAPTLFPRTDLVSIFLTGIEGLNQPANVVASEMLRLNTTTAPTAIAQQSSFGVVGGDTAGYPNGRRPGDDVVDITLRAAMGVLLSAEDAPDGQLAFTDGSAISATEFQSTFPFFNPPLGGSPSIIVP